MIPEVAASEPGAAQTLGVQACARCAGGVEGAISQPRMAGAELPSERLVERSGKAGQRG